MAKNFQVRPGFGSHGGGAGPEDPMIEQRLGKLETQMAGVANSLGDIKITLAEMRGQLMEMPRATNIATIRTDIATDIASLKKDVATDIAAVRTDIAGVKEDLAELRGRVSNLPTTMTNLSMIFTTWAIGSGILIVAMNVLKR